MEKFALPIMPGSSTRRQGAHGSVQNRGPWHDSCHGFHAEPNLFNGLRFRRGTIGATAAVTRAFLPVLVLCSGHFGNPTQAKNARATFRFRIAERKSYEYRKLVSICGCARSDGRLS